jgi:release factor glutamine methyltransferase
LRGRRGIMDENTIQQLITEAAARLAGRSDSARLDAELLLAHAVGKRRAWLRAHADESPTGPERDAFEALLVRRIEGEPVAYLLGSREFWSMTLAVAPGVLIPRPDTETLVHAALEACDDDDAAVADLGTGSGAIALALARERPDWRIVASEADDVALEIARANTASCGLVDSVTVRAAQDGWFGALGRERFKLIVSNPPYIAEDDPCLRQGDLRFEPHGALVAGNDGLDDLRAIVSGAPVHLLPGGWLLLEHGFEQADAVAALMLSAGFGDVRHWRDLAGHQRVTGGRLP